MKKKRKKMKGVVNHNTYIWFIPALADARKEEEERMKKRNTQKKLKLVWSFMVLNVVIVSAIVMNTYCMCVCWCVPLYMWCLLLCSRFTTIYILCFHNLFSIL